MRTSQVRGGHLHRRPHAPRPLNQPLRPNPLPRPLFPFARSYKPPRGQPAPPSRYSIDTTPKKLEWKLTPELRVGILFAETRLSDLICQNECEALEFKGYGKNFITSHGFSPDAFVQMAFQAYFGLYGAWCCVVVFSFYLGDVVLMVELEIGPIECVYEPAMTKAFLHGRTEAITSIQRESVEFTTVCAGFILLDRFDE
jgi:carnitine O-acetyltransferase